MLKCCLAGTSQQPILIQPRIPLHRLRPIRQAPQSHLWLHTIQILRHVIKHTQRIPHKRHADNRVRKRPAPRAERGLAHDSPIHHTMVTGDYEVERVDSEPAAVVIQLEQLRLGAVEVDGEAVLHDRLALEERGDGGEFLVAEEDGLRARVEEGEVAALRVDGYGGRRVSCCVWLQGGEWGEGAILTALRHVDLNSVHAHAL